MPRDNHTKRLLKYAFFPLDALSNHLSFDLNLSQSLQNWSEKTFVKLPKRIYQKTKNFSSGGEEQMLQNYWIAENFYGQALWNIWVT